MKKPFTLRKELLSLLLLLLTSIISVAQVGDTQSTAIDMEITQNGRGQGYNRTFANSELQPFTDTYQGTTGSEIFFKFTMPAGADRFVFATCGTEDVVNGFASSAFLYLLDANGNRVNDEQDNPYQVNQNCGNYMAELTADNLTAGTYYVVVEPYDLNYEAGDLEVEAYTLASIPAGDTRESPIVMNITGEATPFTRTLTNSEVLDLTNKYSGQAGADAYFRFTMPVGTKRFVFKTCTTSWLESGLGFGTSAKLYLIDNTGAVVMDASNKPYEAYNNCGTNMAELAADNLTENATYYVVVDASSTSYVEGDLVVEAYVLNEVTPGDTRANPIDMGITQNGRSQGFSRTFTNSALQAYFDQYDIAAGSEIFFKFTMPAGADRFVFSTCGTERVDYGFADYASLYLLDANGNRVNDEQDTPYEENSNCGANMAELTADNLTANATYYVVVEPYVDMFGNRYEAGDLEVEAYTLATVTLGDTQENPIVMPITGEATPFTRTLTNSEVLDLTNKYSGQSGADAYFRFTMPVGTKRFVFKTCATSSVESGLGFATSAKLYLIDNTGAVVMDANNKPYEAYNNCGTNMAELAADYLTEGATYYVVVDAAGISNVAGDLVVEAYVLNQVTPGDTRADAIDMGITQNGRSQGYSRTFSNSALQAYFDQYDATTGSEIFFKFTMPADADRFVFATCGTEYVDYGFAYYASLYLLDANGNRVNDEQGNPYKAYINCGTGMAELTADNLTENGTYYVVVEPYVDMFGNRYEAGDLKVAAYALSENDIPQGDALSFPIAFSFRGPGQVYTWNSADQPADLLAFTDAFEPSNTGNGNDGDIYWKFSVPANAAQLVITTGASGSGNEVVSSDFAYQASLHLLNAQGAPVLNSEGNPVIASANLGEAAGPNGLLKGQLKGLAQLVVVFNDEIPAGEDYYVVLNATSNSIEANTKNVVLEAKYLDQVTPGNDFDHPRIVSFGLADQDFEIDNLDLNNYLTSAYSSAYKGAGRDIIWEFTVPEGAEYLEFKASSGTNNDQSLAYGNTLYLLEKDGLKEIASNQNNFGSENTFSRIRVEVGTEVQQNKSYYLVVEAVDDNNNGDNLRLQASFGGDFPEGDIAASAYEIDLRNLPSKEKFLGINDVTGKFTNQYGGNAGADIYYKVILPADAQEVTLKACTSSSGLADFAYGATLFALSADLSTVIGSTQQNCADNLPEITVPRPKLPAGSNIFYMVLDAAGSYQRLGSVNIIASYKSHVDLGTITTSLCNQENIELNAFASLPAYAQNENTIAYQWQEGPATRKRTVAQEGNYAVTVTAGSYQYKFTYEIQNSTKEYAFPLDISSCSSSFPLLADFSEVDAATKYFWYQENSDGGLALIANANTNTHTVGADGVYVVNILTSINCYTRRFTVKLNQQADRLPDQNFTIVSGQPFEVNLDFIDEFVSAQWYANGNTTSSGAGRSFTISSAGTYKAVVATKSNCYEINYIITGGTPGTITVFEVPYRAGFSTKVKLNHGADAQYSWCGGRTDDYINITGVSDFTCNSLPTFVDVTVAQFGASRFELKAVAPIKRTTRKKNVCNLPYTLQLSEFFGAFEDNVLVEWADNPGTYTTVTYRAVNRIGSYTAYVRNGQWIYECTFEVETTPANGPSQGDPYVSFYNGSDYTIDLTKLYTNTKSVKWKLEGGADFKQENMLAVSGVADYEVHITTQDDQCIKESISIEEGHVDHRTYKYEVCGDGSLAFVLTPPTADHAGTPLYYKWKDNNAVVLDEGADKSSYSISAAGNYHLEVTYDTWGVYEFLFEVTENKVEIGSADIRYLWDGVTSINLEACDLVQANFAKPDGSAFEFADLKHVYWYKLGSNNSETLVKGGNVQTDNSICSFTYAKATHTPGTYVVDIITNQVCFRKKFIISNPAPGTASNPVEVPFTVDGGSYADSSDPSNFPNGEKVYRISLPLSEVTGLPEVTISLSGNGTAELYKISSNNNNNVLRLNAAGGPSMLEMQSAVNSSRVFLTTIQSGEEKTGIPGSSEYEIRTKGKGVELKIGLNANKSTLKTINTCPNGDCIIDFKEDYPTELGSDRPFYKMTELFEVKSSISSPKGRIQVDFNNAGDTKTYAQVLDGKDKYAQAIEALTIKAKPGAGAGEDYAKIKANAVRFIQQAPNVVAHVLNRDTYHISENVPLAVPAGEFDAIEWYISNQPNGVYELLGSTEVPYYDVNLNKGAGNYYIKVKIFSSKCKSLTNVEPLRITLYDNTTNNNRPPVRPTPPSPPTPSNGGGDDEREGVVGIGSGVRPGSGGGGGGYSPIGGGGDPRDDDGACSYFDALGMDFAENKSYYNQLVECIHDIDFAEVLSNLEFEHYSPYFDTRIIRKDACDCAYDKPEGKFASRLTDVKVFGGGSTSFNDTHVWNQKTEANNIPKRYLYPKILQTVYEAVKGWHSSKTGPLDSDKLPVLLVPSYEEDAFSFNPKEVMGFLAKENGRDDLINNFVFYFKKGGDVTKPGTLYNSNNTSLSMNDIKCGERYTVFAFYECTSGKEVNRIPLIPAVFFIEKECETCR